MTNTAQKIQNAAWEVKHEKSNQTLAILHTIESVDAWWVANQDKYFGVAAEGNVITVCDTPNGKGGA